MPKVSKTHNLKVLHPDIASEWHPSKNGRLKPEELPPGSRRKIWWRCRKGHDWKATVYSRTKGDRCPQCLKESLVKASPIEGTGLIKEWHPTRNLGLNPRSLTSEHKMVWWLCKLGHEWKDTVKSRLKGEGCPHCAGQKVSEDVRHTAKPEGKTLRSKGHRIPLLSRDLDYESESYDGIDFRREKRYPYRASVMIETSRHGDLMYASMVNFSSAGMNIETDYSMLKGERIAVSIKERITSVSRKDYKSVVR